MRGPRSRLNLSIAVAALTLCAGVAYANVYPSGVSVDTATLNDTCGIAKVTFILNENADGDGTNPGVKIEVLGAGDTVVRTVTIARALRGTHSYEWDGRDDSGNRVANGDYKFRVTAADNGYTAWTQIDGNPATKVTRFERPLGVSVNTHAWSPNYGKIYVSQASSLPTAPTTDPRTMEDGIYVLNADCTAVLNPGTTTGVWTGGVNWSGDTTYTTPNRSVIGPDGHLYVSHYLNDDVYEFSPDMTTATVVVGRSLGNFTSAQWVRAIWVTGTQAGGDRVIYTVNDNYNDTSGRRTVIRYQLGAAAQATGTGDVFIDPARFNYYPYDMAMDSAGNTYVNMYRATAGQAIAVQMWAPGTPPLTTPVWTISADYTYVDGITVNDARGWLVYGNYSTGYAWFWDKTTGSFLFSFDTGSRCRDVVFDAVNNLYTVDNGGERLRIWSPPDGANSKDFLTGQFSLSKSGSGGPTITDQPDDLTVGVGATASFTVAASGSNLTYQWLRNGAVMSGQTSATATFTAAGADDSTIYTCRVCDDNGVILSAPAILHVGITITQQPLSASVCANVSNSLTVVAQGVGTLSYQWQKYNGTTSTWDNVVNGGSISGATTAALTFNPTATTDSGAYRVIITDSADPANPATSSGATLTVSDGPVLSHVGYGGTIAVGATHPMSCYASGTGALSYQWKKDGVPIDGATSASYTIRNANCTDHNGLYSCAVTDACGTKESSTSYGGGQARITVGGLEACGNGLDDDCDGVADCEDSDCANDPNCVPPCPVPFADTDGDGDVDQTDFATFQVCFDWPAYLGDPGYVFNAELCRCLDWDGDQDVDTDDTTKFEECASAPGVAASPNCAPWPTGDVVINEVSYDMLDATGVDVTPDDQEFVELYNRGAEAVDIAGWMLRSSSGRNFIIPLTSGGPTWLAAGGYYVIGSGSIFPYPNLIVAPPTDIWGNAATLIELVDRNQAVKDSVLYERNAAGALTSPEGGAWGSFGTTQAALQSLSRYLDGLDTGVNGYDFGLRRRTPGANNLTGGADPPYGSLMTAYVVPNVDGGGDLSGLLGSFRGARIIDPATANDVNPSVIPASPQGGQAILVADTPGGNMVASNDVFQGGASYDMWVYLDTVPYGQGGGESTTYGLVGTTDYLYSFPNPDNAAGFGGDVITANGNTGVGWVYQKETNTSEPDLMSLTLCDFGPGGDSSGLPGSATPAAWKVYATINLNGQASGWHRLKLSYNATTGAVHGEFDAQTFDFTTGTGLVGNFYVGYRESLMGAGAPYTKLRPATFDSVAP